MPTDTMPLNQYLRQMIARARSNNRDRIDISDINYAIERVGANTELGYQLGILKHDNNLELARQAAAFIDAFDESDIASWARRTQNGNITFRFLTQSVGLTAPPRRPAGTLQPTRPTSELLALPDGLRTSMGPEGTLDTSNYFRSSNPQRISDYIATSSENSHYAISLSQGRITQSDPPGTVVDLGCVRLTSGLVSNFFIGADNHLHVIIRDENYDPTNTNHSVRVRVIPLQQIIDRSNEVQVTVNGRQVPIALTINGVSNNHASTDDSSLGGRIEINGSANNDTSQAFLQLLIRDILSNDLNNIGARFNNIGGSDASTPQLAAGSTPPSTTPREISTVERTLQYSLVPGSGTSAPFWTYLFRHQLFNKETYAGLRRWWNSWKYGGFDFETRSAVRAALRGARPSTAAWDAALKTFRATVQEVVTRPGLTPAQVLDELRTARSLRGQTPRPGGSFQVTSTIGRISSSVLTAVFIGMDYDDANSITDTTRREEALNSTACRTVFAVAALAAMCFIPGGIFVAIGIGVGAAIFSNHPWGKNFGGWLRSWAPMDAIGGFLGNTIGKVGNAIWDNTIGRLFGGGRYTYNFS